MLDASDSINIHINAAFEAERNAQMRRDYVGASGIGNPCLRALQMAHLGIKPDRKLPGNLHRIFRIGHVFEDEAANWLCMAGFDLSTTNPDTGKQWGFAVLGGKGKGHLDGILRSGPAPIEYPCLWECKALNAAGWQKVKKEGLAIAKPLYAAQVAIDQAYLDLTNPAVFTVLNKNTEELAHYLIPFDQELAQRMSDKMAMIVTGTQNQVIMPRAHASPDYFECKWCDYHDRCWSMKR